MLRSDTNVMYSHYVENALSVTKLKGNWREKGQINENHQAAEIMETTVQTDRCLKKHCPILIPTVNCGYKKKSTGSTAVVTLTHDRSECFLCFLLPARNS
jgi:hypothetical protein